MADATKLPTHLSSDDLEHHRRAAQRYEQTLAVAQARFDAVKEVAQDAWAGEQAALAGKYQIDGPARIDMATGEITRNVEAPPVPSNGHGAAQDVPPTGARA